MSGKPDAPATAGQPEQPRLESHIEEGSTHECTGPVTIERLRKDDGRALILYSVLADPAEGPSS